jgi:Ras-related protein Rab-28
MGAEDSGEEDEPQQLQFKVILLGDGAVGKTSIAMRFSQDYFAQSYKQTIGVDFFMKRISLPGAGPQVTLQIWDIGGQSIGGKMIGNYIYGAHAVLLCYDITNYESFQDLEDWYRLVRQTFGDKPMPHIALVGNKSDLAHMRTVKMLKHTQFCEENDAASYFVSAKNGENLSTTFFKVAASLAGVTVSKNEIESTAKVVTAEIVNHQRHDPNEPEAGAKPAKKCEIQ